MCIKLLIDISIPLSLRPSPPKHPRPRSQPAMVRTLLRMPTRPWLDIPSSGAPGCSPLSYSWQTLLCQLRLCTLATAHHFNNNFKRGFFLRRRSSSPFLTFRISHPSYPLRLIAPDQGQFGCVNWTDSNANIPTLDARVVEHRTARTKKRPAIRDLTVNET